MRAVLDAGLLIAVERRNRRVGAMLRVLQQDGTPLRTSAAVVGQVWRDGATQVRLARVLAAVATVPLDERAARRCGELQRAAHSDDVADAHLALLVRPGDRILTSDPDDIERLLQARDVEATVVRV